MVRHCAIATVILRQKSQKPCNIMLIGADGVIGYPIDPAQMIQPSGQQFARHDSQRRMVRWNTAAKKLSKSVPWFGLK